MVGTHQLPKSVCTSLPVLRGGPAAKIRRGPYLITQDLRGATLGAVPPEDVGSLGGSSVAVMGEEEHAATLPAITVFSPGSDHENSPGR